MGISASDLELEELRKIAVSGVQSVESDGRKIVYRSLDDQLRILDEASQAASGAPRRRLAIFSRGY
jgi:hypothetical protein